MVFDKVKWLIKADKSVLMVYNVNVKKKSPVRQYRTLNNY